MTNDELLTRLYRVEAKCKLQEALTMCLLPAIDPVRRPLVLQQFQQLCQWLEARVAKEGVDSAASQVDLKAAAAMYSKLVGALEVIAMHEGRKTT